jgi:NADH:ubiquinone oxidoreductase subunit K
LPNPVPEVDGEINTTTARSKELEELELRLLSTEARIREAEAREKSQRYWLRWLAPVMGILVIVGMECLLRHMLHNVFWGPFHRGSGAFLVAMIVAPIASITAITIALFVGAFRKFEEKDVESIGRGAIETLNTFRGG